MQTQLTDSFKHTAKGQLADQILRSCVHCGFCTATCPTYQLLGDELDGPRGRIYLIKQLLEGKEAGRKTQQHLDRCLTCRSCETTCPSGVQYGHLLDIGREQIEQQVSRPLRERLIRQLLLLLLPKPARFAFLLSLGRRFMPVLPASMKKTLSLGIARSRVSSAPHPRKMILLDGCVQPALAPNINQATVRVLDKLNIQTIAIAPHCCGALEHHLSKAEAALETVRRNIDLCWPHIEAGAEAIISTASGCGVMLKDYGHLLRDDPAYREKAIRVSALSKDVGEILAQEDLAPLKTGQRGKIAFHAPCTLQHGQQLAGVVEQTLTRLGFELCEVTDAHLCCGSAGTYSITQPHLSQQLLSNKLAALQQQQPSLIATANIGCLLHLNSRAEVPVKHWIELLA